MSEPTLFDFEPDWVPVVRVGVTLVSLIQDVRCRDCGRKGGGQQGGADRLGVWELCDDCASLDGCLTRESRTPGLHCSRWGITHPESEHDALATAQARRRANYLKKVPA